MRTVTRSPAAVSGAVRARSSRTTRRASAWRRAERALPSAPQLQAGRAAASHSRPRVSRPSNQGRTLAEATAPARPHRDSRAGRIQAKVLTTTSAMPSPASGYSSWIPAPASRTIALAGPGSQEAAVEGVGGAGA
ncbi:hypothetical protein [Actinocorallia longicatena]|uniref:hypothetical protein n=1 Tax=Actinocorallia longicatena TaxID=111803 RepID=UPI0031DD5179